MDREAVKEPGYEALSETSEAGIGDIPDVVEDGRWHPTKSTPFKAVMRVLLFAAAVVMAVSGYSVYTYFSNGEAGPRNRTITTVIISVKNITGM